MCRDMNIEYVILIGAGIVAVGNTSGRIGSGRSNSGQMIHIRSCPVQISYQVSGLSLSLSSHHTHIYFCYTTQSF